VTHLSISGVRKAFGSHTVLADLNLEVPAGSLTAILGSSGSGKTTLLRILAGFERADAGSVTIGGTLVDGPGTHVPPERRRIGYVPQEGSLFPHLTVAANVGFGLPPRQRLGKRTSELLAGVGLADMAKRYPHELSGGQQQRVALARALAVQPAVVLMDEPFAALDANLRASVRADVQQIFRDAGTTALLVTHDQDEALAIADRIAVLRDGRIAQCSAPLELYLQPVDADVARFVGDANLLDGMRHDDVVDTVLGRLPVQSSDAQPSHPRGSGSGGRADPCPVTVLVRPEHIAVIPAGGPAQPGGPAGHVIDCEYYGHDAVLRVQLDSDGALRPIIVRTAGSQLPVGSLVTLQARGPVLTWPRAAGAA
jgi:iron(III) transport system ATP-binding protein